MIHVGLDSVWLIESGMKVKVINVFHKWTTDWLIKDEILTLNKNISDLYSRSPMKEGGMTSFQEEKEKLIRNVKKSVKHLMEESVTKKVDSRWYPPDGAGFHPFSSISRVWRSSPATWAPSVAPWKIVCSSVRSNQFLLTSNQNTSLGLRRRSLGLFKTNSSSALLNKISKECEEALFILKR